MLTEDDKAELMQFVTRHVEAQAAASRMVFKIFIDALSEAAERDLRPGLRMALMSTADSARQMSVEGWDTPDLIADELEAYAQTIED